MQVSIINPCLFIAWPFFTHPWITTLIIFISVSELALSCPVFILQNLCDPVHCVCLVPGTSVMLQWTMSLTVCDLSFARCTHSPNSIRTLSPLHQTSRASASLNILLHAVFFLVPFLACSAVKTAVKHRLISRVISKGNPNENILPTFSLSCHTAHHKCWQETAVPSLTFYSTLSTHSHTRRHAHFLLLVVPLNQQSLERCGGI